MGYLQHIPGLNSTAVMADMPPAGSSCFSAVAPFCSMAMQQQLPFSAVDAGPFSNPMQQQQTILTAGLTVDVGMAAAYTGLSTQDSSTTVLLSPQSVCLSAVPSPAMSRIGSAGVLSPMQSLHDHAGQQLVGSSASGGFMVPASAGYMLSPAQAQYCGNNVLAGQALAPNMTGAAAAQAKARRHSFHLQPSTPAGGYAVAGASAGQFGRVSAAQLYGPHGGYSVAAPDGAEVPMYAPADQRSQRAGDPRMRRFSAEVHSAAAVYAPHMQQAMNVQADIIDFLTVDNASCGGASSAPAPMMYAQSQLYGASAAQASSAHTGPPARAASSGGRQGAARDAAAGRRPFDVRKGASAASAGARQSVDVSCSSAAPKWAGPSRPKADNEGFTPPPPPLPAKKGTGVYSMCL